MDRFIKSHGLYYSSLLCIIVLGLFLVFQSAFDKKLQMTFIVGLGLLYVLWGIVHHVLHHDITAKIVIEYVLMGALGITVVLFFLKGAML